MQRQFEIDGVTIDCAGNERIKVKVGRGKLLGEL